MKKIFVTVEEFLQNGGVLETTTAIYSPTYASKGTYISRPSDWGDNCIMVNNGHTEYSVLNDQCYVCIDCIPIYKPEEKPEYSLSDLKKSFGAGRELFVLGNSGHDIKYAYDDFDEYLK